MVLKPIRWIKKQLKKLFSTLFSREKSNKYANPLLHAAQSNSYIETVSNKADSMHRDIKELYEEDIQKEYLSLMNALAPLFRKGKVRLAIDKHEIGYYGKESSMFIVGTSYGNKSYKNAYEYISISILTGKKEERLHLYALPWHIGQDVVKSIDILLNTIKPWLGKIEVVEFDRGFHNNALIKYLEEYKIPYLIHIRKIGKNLKELIKNTKSFYKGKHTFKINIDKSNFYIKTNLYVCKNIENKDWLFVSSIWFKNKYQIRNLYRNRWQIETNYSINNQNRIMSKSTNYLIRYFYFLCDILLQVLWRICGLCHIPFKTFLRIFVIGIQQIKKMKPTLAAGPP